MAFDPHGHPMTLDKMAISPDSVRGATASLRESLCRLDVELDELSVALSPALCSPSPALPAGAPGVSPACDLAGDLLVLLPKLEIAINTVRELRDRLRL